MKTIVFLILSTYVLCCCSFEGIDPPFAEIFLFDKKTQKFEIQSTNHSDDITVDVGETILIQCRGLGKSVQILYSGFGVPSLSSNTSVIENEDNETHTYTAVLKIADVREDYSGQYKCIYSESPEIFSSFHVFIPGKRIFTISKGREILFAVADTQVEIPCPVSSKNATVQLKRVENGIIQDALNSSVASYDPKRGFSLHLNSLPKSFDSNEDFEDSIEGTYICTARNEDELRIIEFTLKNSRQKVQTSEKPMPTLDGSGQPTNPCKAFHCAPHEDCKVYNGLPKCVCKPFRRGSDCTLGCVSDSDCLKHQKCQTNPNSNGRVHECVSRCKGHICGKNSDCQNDDEGTPICVCKNGYARNSSSLDCNSIAIVSQDVTKNYCNPSRCGPYGKCQLKGGKNTCECITGAVGTPPKCRLGCGADANCPWDERCSALGECINVCKEKICGERALCRTLRRSPTCYCPIGYSGDPNIACYSSTP